MPDEKNEESTVETKETTETPDYSKEIKDLQSELSKRDETIGSLKREVKDLKKSTTESTPEPKKDTKTDDFSLVELTYLKTEGISDPEEVEFVKGELKKANLSKEQMNELFSNDYFKASLEKVRTQKANAKATADVKGEQGSNQKAKETPEYWMNKGSLPEQTPANRKLRAEIARKFIEKEKTGKQFYND